MNWGLSAVFLSYERISSTVCRFVNSLSLTITCGWKISLRLSIAIQDVRVCVVDEGLVVAVSIKGGISRAIISFCEWMDILLLLSEVQIYMFGWELIDL